MKAYLNKGGAIKYAKVKRLELIINAVLVFLFAIGLFFGGDALENLFPILLGIFLAITIISYRWHTGVIENLIGSRDYAVDLIHNAVRFQNTAYKHKWWHEIYDLSENGDFVFTRRIRIDYTSTPIYWYYLELRVIEGESYRDYVDLEIAVTNSATEIELDWVPVEVKPNLIAVAVFLNPTVSAHNPYCEIEISLNWAGAFRSLFQHPFTDPGKITILRQTDHLELEFIAPPNFSFLQMDSSEKSFKAEIEEVQPSERARLRYVVKDVKAATVINYVLRVRPKYPPSDLESDESRRIDA